MTDEPVYVHIEDDQAVPPAGGVWIINGRCEDCVHNERLEAEDPCCDCWCHDDGGDGADDAAADLLDGDTDGQ